ncbi:hypothetical protein V3412_16600 [Pseudomonas aeruginosa]|uniref:hypothetical protein n=1 Tax=Pseudomonas aeruginosa TaxID=287 RepID=UPI002F909A7F
MTESKICTCPSGDGSLRWPCPAHPAEQAGGDERAEFERAFTVQEGIYFDDKRGEYRSMNLCAIEASDAQDLNLQLQGWQARAALAQPSPAHELDPLNLAPHAEAFNEAPADALRPEQAEAERPEVVAVVRAQGFGRVCEAIDADTLYQHCSEGEPLMTVAQHERIVGALLRQKHEADTALAWATRHYQSIGKERDAALARVAELERQEPVALANRGLHAFWVKWTEAAAGLYGPGIKLYAAPVAQAQQLHDLDKQCRDDVARALGLRPNQERGFAWSYLLASIKSCVKASEDSAKAQHSVPEAWYYDAPSQAEAAIIDIRGMWGEDDCPTYEDVASALRRLLAAAPGNSVPQAWLDVQAERRRQVEAEGWTPEHDDEHADGQMAQAAGCYALHAGGIGTDWPDGRQNGAALFWPWDKDSWKPTTPRRDLVKACALALAEIERLDRAGITQSPQPGATTASS